MKQFRVRVSYETLVKPGEEKDLEGATIIGHFHGLMPVEELVKLLIAIAEDKFENYVYLEIEPEEIT